MRWVLALHLALTSILLTACGAVSVGFVSNPQVPSSTISGAINSVSLESTNDAHGNPSPITTVSFLNGGLNNTVTFCGDQRIRFRVGLVVRVEFSQGITTQGAGVCAVLLNVTLIG
jgi:hypothetical protein